MDECVVAVTQDRYGNNLKKKRLQPCDRNNPNKRSRCSQQKSWKFTTGYLIAWHRSLLYHGAKAGEHESFLLYFQSLPHGTYAPTIQNAFSKNSWEQVRRLLHLADNSKADYGRNKEDPLFKQVRDVMNRVMKGIRKMWIAGERICIDESMIKYMGRAISFV
jgi:hypothetical protein